MYEFVQQHLLAMGLTAWAVIMAELCAVALTWAALARLKPKMIQDLRQVVLGK
jgi:hypothetical protein